MAHLYLNGIKSIFFRSPDLRDKISINDASPIEPSYGSSAEVDERSRTRKFGDGYEQISPDGINTETLMLTLTYNNISDIVAKELTRFFRGQGTLYDRDPQEWFYMLVPEPFDDDNTYKKFRIVPKSFSHTWVGYNQNTVSVEVKQVYEP